MFVHTVIAVFLHNI